MQYEYYICKTSWWIYIDIIAEVVDVDVWGLGHSAMKVTDGIWIKFAESPIMEGTAFNMSDLPFLVKGLQMVQDQILSASEYKNTLILIQSLQYNPCNFQEEGLIAAIIEWAARTFYFKVPTINVSFDKKKNKYIFDYEFNADKRGESSRNDI